jgi:hypothetical protein
MLQLRAPIHLPQRRPKSRKRGFIRAYAPDLAAFSIDQAMFFEFLDTAEKACQGAKWLNAINLASIGTMFMPLSQVLQCQLLYKLLYKLPQMLPLPWVVSGGKSIMDELFEPTMTIQNIETDDKRGTSDAFKYTYVGSVAKFLDKLYMQPACTRMSYQSSYPKLQVTGYYLLDTGKKPNGNEMD